MKNIGLVLVMSMMILSCNLNQSESKDTIQKQQTIVQEEANRDGVFIHITEGYNDVHRVLMPLKMAMLMADDKDVLIYMDIHSPELLVKNAKDESLSEFESIQSYIKQLLDKNVGICVCPTCLKVAGYEASDLMAGIQLADKEKFFNFTKGRILNLDY
ncbi:DsrE family protein [Labilibaculum sp.]|uniref:DsrE family protein n=1 Tax=Labilibaculum sp. TaxID=2060723 RepID=UPI0035693C77